MWAGTFRSNPWFEGLALAVPVALGYMPLGFAYGVLARNAGLNLTETVAMSIFVYAGSAQYIAVGMIAAGIPPSSIISTVFLVNLRHVLFSASLAPYLRRCPSWFLGVIAGQITDETYAVAFNYYANHQASPKLHLALNIGAHLSWVLSSLVGGLVGSFWSDPSRYGFDFALASMFIALLLMQIRPPSSEKTKVEASPSRNKSLQLHLRVVVAVVAFLVSLGIAVAVGGNWNILGGTVVAATLGVILQRWFTKGGHKECQKE
ncbi:MAG: AzlC family ABC transporter permease [Clostridia bacterium]|nr:AzlC family ABC transporter permease [Clostridia bacterium]